MLCLFFQLTVVSCFLSPSFRFTHYCYFVIFICAIMEFIHSTIFLTKVASLTADHSSYGSWALEHWLSICGLWAQLLCSMWDLPRPRIKPVSPALAGGFFTTKPPGKPGKHFFFFFASEYLISAYLYVCQYLLNIPSEIILPLIASV